MRRCRELWFVGPREVVVREVGREVNREGELDTRSTTSRVTFDTRALSCGEVRVRALASGISQGTELLLYRGEGPEPFDPSLDAAGAPTYPRRYGYAWVGVVEQVAEQLAEQAFESAAAGASLAVGQRIFALAPHGDEHVFAARALRPLPDGIPDARAVLAANVETAINVVWDAGVGLGDRVVVLGGGVVGLLCAHLSRRAGAGEILVIEPGERRRAAARALGLQAEGAPRAALADADVVIEASGNPAALDQAIAHAGLEATIAIASFYGARTSPVRLGEAFHRRRLTLRSSQVSRLPASKAARWDAGRRFGLVTALLGDAALDVLLDPPVPIDDAAAVYARLDGDPAGALQTVFTYLE